MRKIVFLLFIIIIGLCLIYKKKEVLIPSEAIRIRIIANSNSVGDQKLKADIKNEITALLFNKLNNVSNYQDANNIIKNNLLNIETVISKYNGNYEINYDNNYFPEKEYKGVKYDEGYYPSLEVKLGKGKGENFWCVLFPPLCLIDENKYSNNEYRLLINDLLKKIK